MRRSKVPYCLPDMTDTDRGWLAGFLEGEGHFGKNNHGTALMYPRVSVSQKQLEPLERCIRITECGSIGPSRLGGVHILTWGPRPSRALMLDLYDLMSPRRQEQIRLAMSEEDNDGIF